MSKKTVSIILFIIILIIVVGLGLFLYRNAQIDKFNASILKEKTVSVLFSFVYLDNEKEEHVSSFLILLEPTVKQIGVLEIPSYLAVYDIQSDSYVPIDSYYVKDGYEKYYTVLKEELGVGDINYLFADTQMLSDFVDFMGGVTMFILDTEDNETSLLDNENTNIARLGNVNLDGPDVSSYIGKIETSDNTLLFKSSQRKEFILSILRGLQNKPEILKSKTMYKRLKDIIYTSLTFINIENFNKILSQYNLESILYQKINGTITNIASESEQKTVLFISSEVGSLVQIVQVFEKQIKKSTVQNVNNKITITILNGTVINGLAGKTKELYEAAGFQVLFVGNAVQTDVKKTVLIDRTGNQTYVDLAVRVINTKNVITDITSLDSAGSSITLILGEDFDGESVR